MSAQTSICLVCGRTFEKPAGVTFDQCPDCLKEMKDRYAAPPEPAAPPSSGRKAFLGLLSLFILAGAVAAVQFPKVKLALSLLFPPAPEKVSSTADPKAQCLSNLWHISSLIQAGRWPSEDLTCPLTQRPYLTRTDKGNVVVSCPNPRDHRVKELRVSRTSPSPEEIQ